jgi:F0F1-type ATP synthase epsilon subunit
MSTNTFELQLVSPTGVIVREQINEATFTSGVGVITILPNYGNAVGVCEVCTLVFKNSHSQHNKYLLGMGIYKFYHNQLTIVVDFVKKAEAEDKNAHDVRAVYINKAFNTRDEHEKPKIFDILYAEFLESFNEFEDEKIK